MNKLLRFVIILLFLILFGILLIHIEYTLVKKINFHEYWNPDLYSLSNLKDDKTFNQNDIENGKKIAKESRLVICSLARNVTRIINKNKIRFEYICSKFKDYKIIIFENDSSDNSRAMLNNWQEQNNNVIILKCCDLGNCSCKLNTKLGYEYGSRSKERFAKMALYREQYLKYVNEYYSDYDYMLVIDFDLDGNININGIFDNLNKKDWGAIFCNGRIPIPGFFGMCTILYDIIANVYVNEKYEDIHKKNILDFIKDLILINIKNKHFLEVKSAFNGCGMYKISKLKNCSYIRDNRICEHINLAKCIYDNNEKLYINLKWNCYFNIQGPHPFKFILNL